MSKRPHQVMRAKGPFIQIRGTVLPQCRKECLYLLQQKHVSYFLCWFSATLASLPAVCSALSSVGPVHYPKSLVMEVRQQKMAVTRKRTQPGGQWVTQSKGKVTVSVSCHSLEHPITVAEGHKYAPITHSYINSSMLAAQDSMGFMTTVWVVSICSY